MAVVDLQVSVVTFEKITSFRSELFCAIMSLIDSPLFAVD